MPSWRVGDTWPPLRGHVSGTVADNPTGDLQLVGFPVSFAASRVGGGKQIAGTAVPSEDVTGDWSYLWQAGDTDTAGTFEFEVRVEWEPGVVETFPNSGADNPTFTIEPGVDD